MQVGLRTDSYRYANLSTVLMGLVGSRGQGCRSSGWRGGESDDEGSKSAKMVMWAGPRGAWSIEPLLRPPLSVYVPV